MICATPRSGSTLLCDLLEATAVAGRPASYFRKELVPDWARRLGVAEGPPDSAGFARAYLAAVLREGAGGTGVFGLRLMWESVGELSALLDRVRPGLPGDAARFAAAFGPVRFLHLSRADKVTQGVSHLRAIQTGLWHLGADGTERERTTPPAAPAYDPERIAAYAAEAEAHDAAWRRWFAANRISPTRLTYEALARDPRATLARALAGLGLDPAAAARAAPRTARIADAESRAWAARFRADRGGR